jgi:hypothetical protein
MFGKKRVLDPRSLRALEVRQAETAQKARTDKILLLINKFLKSEQSRAAKVGPIGITGWVKGAHIFETSGSTQWVTPLLAALRDPKYKGYVVSATVVVSEPSVAGLRKKLPLNEANPFQSVLDARQKEVPKQRDANTLVYVSVRIRLRD